MEHAGSPHVWGIDLTVAPTSGWWAPWQPHAVLPVWPFCWWITAVVDVYSRAVVAFAVFRSQPSGAEIAKVLERAVVGHGTQPAHIVSDQGVQFRTEYRVAPGRATRRGRRGARR